MELVSYDDFLDAKVKYVQSSGIEVVESDIQPHLYPFQKKLVAWALQMGKAAIFADTGLGKTMMMLEWADHILKSEGAGRQVLIVAPLCVSTQIAAEGGRFGYDVGLARDSIPSNSIVMTNYERVDRFDDDFIGVVLDESSILKHLDGKTRRFLIDRFAGTRYRLSCTATPAPNDFMEYGGQAEFLGVLSTSEMLATYFIHDGGDTSKWRLKGHGQEKFWEWVAHWAAVVFKPSDLGDSDDRFELPPLIYHDHVIETNTDAGGNLFPMGAVTLQERIKARRETATVRCEAVAAIINASDRPWVIWCNLNAESQALAKLIPDAVAVAGSDKLEVKEHRIMGFTNGEIRVLVTKPSIAGFGMNWQHCADMAFVGLNDSWERFYQAVRRCWRFGQKNPVNAHIFSADIESATLANIQRKEDQAQTAKTMMGEQMAKFSTVSSPVQSCGFDKYQRDVKQIGNAAVHLADCIDLAREMTDETVGYTIFSPPFSSLYTYSASDRDMGNAASHTQFYEHFDYLIPELYRMTKPGRHVSFHCFQIPLMKARDGVIGLMDLRGELIRMFQKHGFIYHSEVTIWKDPVTQMQRTKALGLLHKTIRKDSSMSRMGLADYVVTMRKPGENPTPIPHTHDEFPVSQWQEWASPVWMDIDPGETLNRKEARETDDERHIAPLQLGVIRRCILLWSKECDLVFSPFMGIGSEGYVAIENNRRFVGAELKRSYWELACKHIARVVNIEQQTFDLDAT